MTADLVLERGRLRVRVAWRASRRYHMNSVRRNLRDERIPARTSSLEGCLPDHR